MKLIIPTAIVAAAALLSACDRYLVTVNEQPVSQPRPLFSDFEVPDRGLNDCLRQAIADGEIRRPGQLEALTCSHAGIVSLEGIQVFSNLRTVNLANNRIVDPEPLLFLGTLHSVSLVENPDLDCDKLAALKAQLPPSGELHSPSQCDRQ